MIVNHVSRVMGAKRLTIREVARRSGLAYATVQGIRNGTSKRVDWDTLDALCTVLEVESISELIEYRPDGYLVDNRIGPNFGKPVRRRQRAEEARDGR